MAVQKRNSCDELGSLGISIVQCLLRSLRITKKDASILYIVLLQDIIILKGKVRSGKSMPQLRLYSAHSLLQNEVPLIILMPQG